MIVNESTYISEESDAPHDDESYNAGDRRKVDKRRKKNDFLKNKRMDGLRLILGDPQARCYLNSLLEFCGLFRVSYATHSNQTCFNEGMRNVGLHIYAEIAAVDETKILTLLQEK